MALGGLTCQGSEARMSDLQCPVIVVLVPRECLASGACARAFEDRRLAGVFVEAAIAEDANALAAISGMASASQCGIERLGPIASEEDLEEAAEQLADQFRGETIALVTTASVIRSKLHRATLPTAPVTVAIDSSGWIVTSD